MTRWRIIFSASVSFSKIQCKAKTRSWRQERTGEKQADFSNSFRLFLFFFSTAANLWRFHQDHNEMKSGRAHDRDKDEEVRIM